MRMWDLRSNLCQGVLQVPNAVPTAAYDHQVVPCARESVVEAAVVGRH